MSGRSASCGVRRGSLRQAHVRSIVERLEGPARQGYADGVTLGVVHRASGSAGGITAATHCTALGLVTAGGFILVAVRGRADMKPEPVECADHRRYEGERGVIGPIFIRPGVACRSTR
jgi:hypothetical protein